MERIRKYSRFVAMFLLVVGLSLAAVSTTFAQVDDAGTNVIIVDSAQNQEADQDQDVEQANTSDQDQDQDLEQGVWFQAGGAGDTTLADTYVASEGNQAQDQMNDQSNANDQDLDQEQNATNTGIIFDNDDYSDDDINIYGEYVEVNIYTDSSANSIAIDTAELNAQLSAELNQILAGLLAGGTTA